MKSSNPSFKDWFMATRPWSFVVTIFPTLFTLLFVLLTAPQFSDRWPLGLLAMFGAIIFQSSSNLLSDYSDFQHGVDKPGTVVGHDILTSGRFKPKEILIFGSLMTLTGTLIGLYLLSQTGWVLLFFGLFGMIGADFYSFFKTYALGDLLSFLVYGPLIMFGTYYVMTQQFSLSLLLISFHFSLTSVALLHANNLRDIRNDTRAGLQTVASFLGLRKSIIYYNLMTYLSYLVIVIAILLAQLPVWSLLSFLALPIALRNSKKIHSALINPAVLTSMDKASAQFHLLVSLALLLSLVIPLAL